mmetsp:Transcript_140730/g.262636  ORF Transcript_140730/g.262636 Transcript_140730/m.262636 type:complete len:567 (-) Transcript_140730:70-1770(-)
MSLSLIGDAAHDFADAIHNTFRGQDRKQQIMTIGFFCAALFFSIVPFETAQLAFALFGALTYAVVQSIYTSPAGSRSKAVFSRKGGVQSSMAGPQRSASKGSSQVRPPVPSRGFESNKRGDTTKERVRHTLNNSEQPHKPHKHVPKPEVGKQEVRKPSLQPIAAPVFQSQGWDAEVQELVAQISPTPEGDLIVQRIADFVEQKIRTTIPEADVTGFTSGDLSRGTAFGVAVPDVDIVVSVSPHILAKRLQTRFHKGALRTDKLDRKKLQKSAIRTCTDKLVSSGTIKFRRSAFRGEEPKVTLLVPASFGVFKEAIPVDFTVNGCTPLYNAALLTECGQKDPRAKSLILLVKRWAKDRGVCHAAKGHLSPYPWNLLTVYFLQVADTTQKLLPPVEEFEASVRLMVQSGAAQKPPDSPTDNGPPWSRPSADAPQKSVGDLLKEFFHFYSKSFDWRNEAVCVRTGKRGPPGLSLPLHIIVDEANGTSHVGPSIEDPFDPSRNIGACMNMMSLARLREEIARADELCTNGCSLSELLKPWAPPENAAGVANADDDEAAEEQEERETIQEL